MKKTAGLLIIMSLFSVLFANDNDLQSLLAKFPKEVIEDFYQNGILHAEPYNFSQLSLPASPKTKSFFISPISPADTQYRNECGGMSSAFVMRFYGESATGDKIYQEITGKNYDGTISPKPLKNYWDTKTDYNVHVFKGNIDNLKEVVSHNIPVIVLINCKGGWHYVPVVGFDKKYIYIQDSVSDFRNVKGKPYNRRETYKDFEKLWNVVLPESDHLMFIAVKK